MRILIVAAPPSSASLTARVVAAADDELNRLGHETTVLDLVESEWDPVVRASDYGLARLDRPVGRIGAEAIRRGSLHPELRRHVELVREADLIVFAFPLWWFGMPAILKGWVDRVFLQGFAFGLHDTCGNPKKYGDGAFSGKRGLVITSAGDRASAFSARGLNGGIHDVLFPITHGIFWYTGIAALESLTLLGVDTPLWEGADAVEATVRERMGTLFNENPIAYRWMLDDYDSDRVLRPEVASGVSGFEVHRMVAPANRCTER